MADDLPEPPFGLYERLVTHGLQNRLLQFDSAKARADRNPLDRAEAAATLARHFERLLERELSGLPEEDRLAKQAALTNGLIELLQGPDEADDDKVALPPEELKAIAPVTLEGLVAPLEMLAPLVPLSASDLLVNGRGEPGLAPSLAREIPSADSIDLLCAFVRWHGLRILEPQLRAHLEAKKPLRVITTVYTGSTERRALDWLASLGAQIKVSYDTQSTRLHAKAWKFERRTGYSTAYIGSSNLSKSALLDGVEWNVRLSEVSSPNILEKFDATFESYWLDPDYETYEPARDRDRVDAALARAGGQGHGLIDEPLALLDVTPRPYQTELLERLAAERARHHRHKNLIVAATGTGKTVVSALDFKSLQSQLGNPTLLFVAHRQEILKQSRGTFRQVLRDGTFGELFVDGKRPTESRHVFASVQSLGHLDLSTIPPAHFDVIIVDEFHHASASTYARVLKHFQPRELIGLTATPERADGADILHYFGGHISVELRLWEALERGLLAPFQYFGLNDETDLSSVQWSRGSYDAKSLEKIYTGDDARVRLVLQQVYKLHADPGNMRALGFCVSIAHAEFMASRFTAAGLPSLAVSADTTSDARADALKQLKQGTVRVLFAVDIFNEGVDVPSVDTLLFLRPTESPVVFMQQLGRGLRRADNKDCVTVLDFIGQANRKFRFDLRYRAITGATRTEVERQVNAGFPFLPAGCTMQLDRVAKEIVLNNLRNALPLQRPKMVRELRDLVQSPAFAGRTVGLGDFLEASGLELEDVYKGGSWASLKRAAGVLEAPESAEERKIGDRLVSLLHIDDPLRLGSYRSALTGAGEPDDERVLTALHLSLLREIGPATTLAESIALLRAEPALTEELLELLDLLEDRATHLTYPLDDELGWQHHVPLSVHARHTTDEIFAAFGLKTFDKGAYTQTGVVRDETTNSDFFLVTLEKSDRDYSPTTRYHDYAISPTQFHWQSQSKQTQRSKTGQRYINHRSNRGNILLFVRQCKQRSGRAEPYTFLGPVDYVSHHGERPINFVWHLRRPMPADFFRQAKVVGG